MSMLLITSAYEFAKKKYSLSYIIHLEDVYNVLNFYLKPENNLELFAASYLHDILKDTDTSYQELVNMFGMNIAELVYLVTDELGRNRKERNEKTYSKIVTNGYAVILKLADRIANINTCNKYKNYEKLNIYENEYEDFRNALKNCNDRFVGGGWRCLEEMWNSLDRLIDFPDIDYT